MFQDNYLIVVPVYVSWDILMHEKLLYLWFNDVIDTVKVEIKEESRPTEKWLQILNIVSGLLYS